MPKVELMGEILPNLEFLLVIGHLKVHVQKRTRGH